MQVPVPVKGMAAPVEVSELTGRMLYFGLVTDVLRARRSRYCITLMLNMRLPAIALADWGVLFLTGPNHPRYGSESCTKPSELPVEQVSKFKLVVDVKIAQAWA